MLHFDILKNWYKVSDQISRKSLLIKNKREFNAVARQKLALRQNQKEDVFHIYAFTFNTKPLTGTSKKMNKSNILTEASASVCLSVTSYGPGITTVSMVTSVARKPIKSQTMVICNYYGIVWQKSNIGFWVNFQFQNHYPRYKITVSSLLKVPRRHVACSRDISYNCYPIPVRCW